VGDRGRKRSGVLSRETDREGGYKGRPKGFWGRGKGQKTKVKEKGGEEGKGREEIWEGITLIRRKETKGCISD